MRNTREEFPHRNFVANAKKLDQEIFSSVLKQWRKRFAYASIFAAVPTLVVSQLQVAQTVEARKTESNYPGRGARPLDKLNSSPSKRALLKRQSQFLLPHQKGNFVMVSALGGTDDCPGAAIPGGNYTAAAPFVQVGDTTGANDTISTLPSYYYYSSYGAHGPDHVYSFTLTGFGPNPRIEVSTTSDSYKPLIYVLRDDPGACPGGTGNLENNFPWVMYDSRGTNTSTVTVNIDFLPLNVPFYLFVDSQLDDTAGAGPYTIRMQDVTIAPVPDSNPIDSSEFFVRQHYLDFLNRQPDQDGLAFWTNEITSCGGDQACIEARRINDSGSFFLSIEFQETGYLVYRMYKASYGNLPGAPVPITQSEFLPDTQKIGQDVIVRQSGWEQKLENNKQAFAAEFVQRSRFVSTYPTSMSSEQFVDALFANAGVTPSATDRAAAINEFAFSATTEDLAARARALRRVAENSTLARQEFNRAFVLMQYFGYLRRNPNDAPDGNFVGYNFWLDKLNQFDGDFIDAEMVKAFLASDEYRQRFGH